MRFAAVFLAAFCTMTVAKVTRREKQIALTVAADGKFERSIASPAIRREVVNASNAEKPHQSSYIRTSQSLAVKAAGDAVNEPADDVKEVIDEAINEAAKTVKAAEKAVEAVKDLKQAVVPAPSEVDLSELILLAGSAQDRVDLAPGVLAELGWTAEIRIADRTVGAVDHAWTFSKGGHCLAVFAGANDDTDSLQFIQGLTSGPEMFCGFNIHKGVVEELQAFINASNWNHFISFLNSPSCTSVTAVGHSLGGSVASVFAACANNNDVSFGTRSDYGLVVFAPFAVAMNTPLYSGTEGTPFVGTRYGIVGREGLPSNSKQFRLDIATMCRDVALAAGEVTGSSLASLILAALRVLPQAFVEPAYALVWAAGQSSLLQCGLGIYNYVISPPAGAQALRNQILDTLHQMFERGDLFDSTDSVNALSSHSGFTHALVDFQAMENVFQALEVEGDAGYAKVFANTDPGVTALPQVDFFQNLLSICAVSGAFPNHGICCYSSADDCSSKFNVTDKACQTTPEIYANKPLHNTGV